MKKVKLLCAALAFPLLAACGDDAGSFAGQGDVTSLEAEPSAVISAAQEMASPSPEAEEDSGVSYPYCSDEGDLADMMARCYRLSETTAAFHWLICFIRLDLHRKGFRRGPKGL